MCETAVEQHVELDQGVKCRITYNLSTLKTSVLVIEDEYTGANNVDMGVLCHEVNLCLNSLRRADVVCVHARNVRHRWITQSNLNTHVKCFR